MSEAIILDPLLRQPLITERDISKAVQVDLPAGVRIVSADSHLEIADFQLDE